MFASSASPSAPCGMFVATRGAPIHTPLGTLPSSEARAGLLQELGLFRRRLTAEQRVAVRKATEAFHDVAVSNRIANAVFDAFFHRFVDFVAKPSERGDARFLVVERFAVHERHVEESALGVR